MFVWAVWSPLCSLLALGFVQMFLEHAKAAYQLDQAPLRDTSRLKQMHRQWDCLMFW